VDWLIGALEQPALQMPVHSVSGGIDGLALIR
jgi:hypothetical protein